VDIDEEEEERESVVSAVHANVERSLPCKIKKMMYRN
jgi:hypothetical protein